MKTYVISLQALLWDDTQYILCYKGVNIHDSMNEELLKNFITLAVYVHTFKTARSA